MSALSLVDSPLFGSSFVDPETRALFDSDAFVARCVEVEVALARAEARLGVIPEAAARDIAAAAETCAFDHARLQRETELVGYPILPIVEQLADAAGDRGAVPPLGRNHAGHHEQRHDPPGAQRPGPDRTAPG
jgi:3-carboxy-cis,cis-muconate cycloisomerase